MNLLYVRSLVTLKAYMDATKALAEMIGHVHRGFKKEVVDVWPALEKMLLSHK